MQLIAAVDRNWAIGRDGDQLAYLKADLKRFKALTTAHTVILGRRTLATFPGGRPLPGRRNLVLSGKPDFRPQGAEVFSSLETLLAVAPADAFGIGGGSVYWALLPWCDRAYVTKIDAVFPGADTWFPDLDAREDWTVEAEEPPLEEGGLPFRYVTYRRIGSSS